MKQQFGKAAASRSPHTPVSKAERDHLIAGRQKPTLAPELRPNGGTVQSVHQRIERLREKRISEIEKRLSEMRGQLTEAHKKSSHKGRARGAFRAKSLGRERA